MPDALRAPAPAKVNLVLEVTGLRADGYHEVDTVLQTLALADTASLAFDASREGVTVAGPFAGGCPADETNLAWRAAARLAALLGRTTAGLAITLEKHIPAAAGLGGGASNAATVLRLLQRRWPEATDDHLSEAANAVGSDVPFFLLGGTCRARGRGERVASLPDLPPHGVVLFVPRETLERKTPRMFAALDRFPFDSGAVAGAFAARPPRALGSAGIYNAFERVAFDLFPGLHALWEDLERRLGEPVRLAGAGPTLFWIGPHGRRDAVALAATGAGCGIISTGTAVSQWRP